MRVNRLTGWKILATLPALAALLTPLSPRAAGEDWGEAVIVLDGSGSMRGQLGKSSKDGTSKFDAVRAVLKDTLPKLGANLNLGVVAFGHRRGDCGDIETITPVGKLDEPRLQEMLGKYTAKGKGPVSNALKHAAGLFTDKSRPASAIIVADNSDNCNVDACAVAREIKQNHRGFQAHVIAVGVPDNEISSLACIADNTGGKLIRVGSQTELAAAMNYGLTQAAASARPAKPVPAVAAQPPPAPVPNGPPSLRLTALLATSGPPIQQGLKWRVTKSGAGTAIPPLYEGADAVPVVKLPPGKYDVDVVFGFASKRETVEVGEHETPAAVVLNSGVLRLKATAARGDAPLTDAFITLYGRSDGGAQASQPMALSREPTPEYHLPEGEYRITVQQGLNKTDRTIKVLAGSAADVELSFDMGEFSVRAVAYEGGTPLDDMLFLVYEDDPEAAFGRREVARSAAQAPSFLLPAGIYQLIARRGGVVGRERLTVRAGSNGLQTIVLGSGQLALSSRLVGRTAPLTDRISYAIERIDAQNRDIPLTTNRPAAAINLVQGRYRVEGRFGLARIVREVEVKAGSTTSLAMEHQAGLVRFRLADGQGGPALTDVFWEIRDRSGAPIWRSALPEPKLAMAAGTYTIVAQHQDRSRQRTFEVVTGDETTIEVPD